MYAFLFEDGNAKRGVAQLVARSVRDAEVVGSIPVASTKFRRAQIVHGGICFDERVEKNPRITVGSRERNNLFFCSIFYYNSFYFTFFLFVY